MAVPPVVHGPAYVRHYHAIGQGCRRGNWATQQYPTLETRQDPLPATGHITRLRQHATVPSYCADGEHSQISVHLLEDRLTNNYTGFCAAQLH
jgi:hypothetical protein